MKRFLRLFKILRPRYLIQLAKIFSSKVESALGLELGRTLNIREIILENGYSSFLEVGVWRGENIIPLAKSINSCQFIGVDPYDFEEYGDNEKLDDKKELLKAEANQIYSEMEKTSSHLKNLKIIRKSSLEAALEFSDNSLDMIFIDALHTYEDVKKDIKAWLPKVRVGGCLSGHDYSLDWFGVVMAVNDVLGVDNVIIKSDSTWFYFKK